MKTIIAVILSIMMTFSLILTGCLFVINYVVLNLDRLNYVSLESIAHIIKYNKKILKKKKHLLICDSNQRRNRIFKNIIPNINNELDAFSLI